MLVMLTTIQLQVNCMLGRTSRINVTAVGFTIDTWGLQCYSMVQCNRSKITDLTPATQFDCY